jgi:MFS family permease
MFTGKKAWSYSSVYEPEPDLQEWAYNPGSSQLPLLPDEEKQVYRMATTKSSTPRAKVHDTCGEYSLRPSCFSSVWTETGFIISISLSQVFDEYLTSGFFALMPVLMEEFQLSDTSIAWPATVTPLFISAFLLPFGRLVDIYGGFAIYVGGLAWASSWTLLAGLTNNYTIFMFCRAMQGLGAAAHLPAGLAILGKVYSPGPRKNMVFSIYGAMAPLGSFVGILVASLVSQYGHWSLYFWIGAIIAILALLGTAATRPLAGPACSGRTLRMDWAGSIGLATSLMLLVFSITEAADAEQWWRSPRVVATGILAMAGFAVTAVIELRFADQPLVPASLFQICYIRPLLLGLLPSYGAVSVYTCYATLQ